MSTLNGTTCFGSPGGSIRSGLSNSSISYLNLLPSNFDLLEEARLAGYQKLLFSLEVFGESYFRSICPEKYELVGFNRFIDAMKLSVEIFGKGQVRCNFVLGAQPVENLKKA